MRNTTEEKMELLNELLKLEETNDIGNLTRSDRAEFQMWVKEMLEQASCKEAQEEPCEDCISREEVKAFYADWYGYGYRENTFYKHLCNMPSVTPQKPVCEEREKGECPYYAGY